MSFEVTVTPTVYDVEVAVNPSVQPFDVEVTVGNVPDLDLTTNGDSGASTFDPLTGELNIPEYTLDGLGGVPESRTITINGTTQDLSADRTFTIPAPDPVTIGSPANGLAIDGNQVLTIGLASGSQTGALSSTDWTTFNGKQNAIGYTPENVANKSINLTSPDDTKYPTTLAVSTALAGKQDLLTNPITGTGTAGQVSFWNGTSTQTGDSGLNWDNVNKRLGIGLTNPSSKLTIDSGDIQFTSIGNYGLRWANGTRFYEQNSGDQRVLLLSNNDRFEILNESGNVFIAGFHGANSGLPNSIRFFNGVIIGSTYSNTATPISNGLIVQGNTLLNTTTDAGFRLDVNGTARVQGALSVTTGGINLTGAQTISTSTGNLTLASDGGNGNIIFSANSNGKYVFSNDQANIEILKTASSIDFTRPSANYIRASAVGGTFNFTVNGNGFTNPALIITAGNQIGINNVTPSNTLDVNGTARIRTISNATGDFLTTNANGVIQKRTALESITDMASNISGWNASVRQRLEHTTAGVLEWVNV